MLFIYHIFTSTLPTSSLPPISTLIIANDRKIMTLIPKHIAGTTAA